MFARRIGDVGGKRKLDDWSIERNSSRASDGVALEEGRQHSAMQIPNVPGDSSADRSDRVLWGSEVRVGDIPGRGARRYGLLLVGVGRLCYVVLGEEGLFAQFEAIDAIGDETHAGDTSLGAVECTLEGGVRSGGAGCGESHWARGHENEVVGITVHGRRVLYRQ